MDTRIPRIIQGAFCHQDMKHLEIRNLPRPLGFPIVGGRFKGNYPLCHGFNGDFATSRRGTSTNRKFLERG